MDNLLLERDLQCQIAEEMYQQSLWEQGYDDAEKGEKPCKMGDISYLQGYSQALQDKVFRLQNPVYIFPEEF